MRELAQHGDKKNERIMLRLISVHCKTQAEAFSEKGFLAGQGVFLNLKIQAGMQPALC